MRKHQAILLAGVTLMASLPAYAQDTGATEESGANNENDIVVTARRRDESLQDVPQTVSAVTSETIQKLRINNASDIAQIVPGLSIEGSSSGSGGFGSSSGIRGVPTFLNSNASPVVQFYLNDAPTGRGPEVTQALFDIGQVEVLKGPQGTLRGRSAPTGAITITTRRPDLDETGGFVNMSGSTRENINVQAAVGVPIVPGVQSYLSGRTADNDGKASSLEWLPAADVPKVPVDVAATGPATIAAGARQADRLTFNLGADRDRIRESMELARCARDEAGLPVDDLSFGAYLTVAPHSNRRVARDMVKAVTAVYARFQAMPGHPSDRIAPGKAAVIKAVGESYDGSRHGRDDGLHVAALNDAFIDDFAVVGTADECVDKLGGLLQLGLDRLIMVGPSHMVAPEQSAEARHLLSAAVLPELRRGAA